MQYADFALWHRELLGERGRSRQPVSRRLAYWRAARRAARAAGTAADRPAPTGPRMRAAPSPSRSARRLHRGRCGTWRSARASLLMVLAAALAALLTRLGPAPTCRSARWTAGRDDDGAGRAGRVVRQHAGAADRHRRRADFPRAAGPGPGHGAGRASNIRRCRSSTWSRSCNPPRSPGAHPLFQVMLAVHNTGARPGSRSTGLACDRRARRGGQVAKFDLHTFCHRWRAARRPGHRASWWAGVLAGPVRRPLPRGRWRPGSRGCWTAAVTEPDRPVGQLGMLGAGGAAPARARLEPAPPARPARSASRQPSPRGARTPRARPVRRGR